MSDGWTTFFGIVVPAMGYAYIAGFLGGVRFHKRSDTPAPKDG